MLIYARSFNIIIQITLFSVTKMCTRPKLHYMSLFQFFFPFCCLVLAIRMLRFDNMNRKNASDNLIQARKEFQYLALSHFTLWYTNEIQLSTYLDELRAHRF